MRTLFSARAENFQPQLARRIIRPLLAAALGFALIFTTISCDTANPSALVGRWIEVSGETKGAVMELLSDGTGIVTYEKAFREAGAAITWKTESGRFYVTVSGVASASAYKLQGSQLTFTEDNGKVSEYVKCNKDCKEAAKEYAEAEKAKAEAAEAKKAKVEKAKAEAAEAAEAKKAKAAEAKVVAAVKAKGGKAEKGSFADSRDGKKYKTMKLNNQTWMAENLNFNAEGSKCYNNQDGNCQKYGRLYNWSTAKAACPSGWHLPSDDEWQTLVNFAGGDIAGKILKASSGWNGVDIFSFLALPGGYGNSNGSFLNVGEDGYWWSSTEYDAAYAYRRSMYRNNANVFREDFGKPTLYSVRCLQD